MNYRDKVNLLHNKCSNCSNCSICELIKICNFTPLCEYLDISFVPAEWDSEDLQRMLSIQHELQNVIKNAQDLLNLTKEKK